jgi:hypothetical protein
MPGMDMRRMEIPGHYMPGRACGALLFFVRPKKSNKRKAGPRRRIAGACFYDLNPF